MSYCVELCRLVSSCVVLCHFVSYCVELCRTVSNWVDLCRMVSNFVERCRTLLNGVRLRKTESYYVVLCSVKSTGCECTCLTVPVQVCQRDVHKQFSIEALHSAILNFAPFEQAKPEPELGAKPETAPKPKAKRRGSDAHGWKAVQSHQLLRQLHDMHQR